MSVPDPSSCSCGCVLAAWSMPWPVATAPWVPEVVHDATPVPHSYALTPDVASDPAAPAVAPVDLDLVDADVTEVPITGRWAS